MKACRKHEAKVVACLFLILFAGVADSQILSPLLPDIRTDVGGSSFDMGLLYTGYALCAGVSALVWGPLSDAFGRRKGLLCGLAVFAIGSGLSATATRFVELLLGRIVTGMGASMLSLNCISYAADFFPYAKRGWAMGSIFSSYFAALILGVPLGSWFSDRLGWNAVFGAMGVLALGLLLCTLYLLPSLNLKLNIKGAQGFKPPVLECVRQYAGFLRTQSAFGALLSSLLASAGAMGFLAFLGTWLHDSFGIPGRKVGLIFLVFGAAALAASPLAGSVADRIGKRLQFVLSSLVFALLLFILPNLHWGPGLFLVFCLISLAAAFRQGPMEAVLTEIVPSSSRGSFVALKNSFSQIGIALATFVSGILFERVGYGAVCLLAGAANFLAAVAMLLTLRMRHL